MPFDHRHPVLKLIALLFALAIRGGFAQMKPASITIDAGKATNPISAGLYGQFVEVMFGGVDGPLGRINPESQLRAAAERDWFVSILGARARRPQP
jgi:hypothetical protein